MKPTAILLCLAAAVVALPQQFDANVEDIAARDHNTATDTGTGTRTATAKTSTKTKTTKTKTTKTHTGATTAIGTGTGVTTATGTEPTNLTGKAKQLELATDIYAACSLAENCHTGTATMVDGMPNIIIIPTSTPGGHGTGTGTATGTGTHTATGKTSTKTKTTKTKTKLNTGTGTNTELATETGAQRRAPTAPVYPPPGHPPPHGDSDEYIKSFVTYSDSSLDWECGTEETANANAVGELALKALQQSCKEGKCDDKVVKEGSDGKLTIKASGSYCPKDQEAFFEAMEMYANKGAKTSHSTGASPQRRTAPPTGSQTCIEQSAAISVVRFTAEKSGKIVASDMMVEAAVAGQEAKSGFCKSSTTSPGGYTRRAAPPKPTGTAASKFLGDVTSTCGTASATSTETATE